MKIAPKYRDAGGLPYRPRRTADYRGIDLSTQPVPPEPHPQLGADTRTLHLWLVESSVYFHGAGVAAISAAVCLPRWSVEAVRFARRFGVDAHALAWEPDDCGPETTTNPFA